MKTEASKFEIDHMTQDSWRLFRIMGEFAIGFDRMSRLKSPAVTVFGSARAGHQPLLRPRAQAGTNAGRSGVCGRYRGKK